MYKKRKKIGILTGGGDTQPLNAVIFSLRDQCAKAGIELSGFLDGWKGVLEKEQIDLRSIPDYGHVGGTLLKSSRVNLLSGGGFRKANRNLSEAGIDFLVVIGGDDTLSNVYGIESVPCIGISKTIDNDVGSLSVQNGQLRTVNYFTLGYPTAANKICRFVSLEEGVRTTAYSHERIMIVESMGMQAGWLAMASSAGKPDFILIPEFPFDYDRFLHKLKESYSRYRNAVVVIAEGAKYNDGSFVQIHSSESDAFGNPRFGGASFALRDKLKADLKGFMNVRNVNAVNPSYWYRSGAPDPLDRLAAGKMANRCFELAAEGSFGGHRFVTIERTPSGFEAADCALSDFPQTEKKRFPKRSIDPAFYDPESFSAAPLWEEYIEPIVSFRSTINDYGFY